MSITYEDAARALDEAVKEKGADYLYEPPSGDVCSYSDREGNPSCIVGHVIAKLNPEAFQKIAENEWYTLYDDEEDTYPIVKEANVRHIELTFGVELGFTDKAENLLLLAQDRQDRGIHWGEAVQIAKQMAKSIAQS